MDSVDPFAWQDDHHTQESRPEFELEDGPDSLSSEDEAAKISTPSLKKRKNVEKRVISVPIGDWDANGGRSKGEAYPPSDSWAWRKYGQKPIKGSPHPRGYYRCSSSKGCPARKQVERSRVDPTVLLVTYASDHNHDPVPAPSTATSARNNQHRGRSAAESPPAEASPDDISTFACYPDLGCDPLLDLDWLAADVASTSLLESPIWTGDGCLELGASVAFTYGVMREEDESLFGDLGELPECTAVFGRRKVAEPEGEGRRRRSRRWSAVPCVGGTK